MLRVVIESPLSGNKEKNKAYARRCMLDSLERGEAPYASHLLFDQPGLLDDDKPEDRKVGMEAGFKWGECADLVAVYIDLGISGGMREGIKRARARGQIVQYRCFDVLSRPKIRLDFCSLDDCDHEVEDLGNGWGRCAKCGDDTFPTTAETAGEYQHVGCCLSHDQNRCEAEKARPSDEPLASETSNAKSGGRADT